MKTLKKVISFLLSLVLIVSSVTFVSAKEKAKEDVIDIEERIKNAEAKGHRYSYITMADGEVSMKNGTVRMNKWSTSRSDKAEFSLHESRLYRNKYAANPIGTGHNPSVLYMYLDGNYWKGKPSKRIAVTIEYIDVEKASMDLYYSTSVAKLEQPQSVALHALRTQGTNEWKTITYYIEDFDPTVEPLIYVRNPSIQNPIQVPNMVPLGNIFIEENLSEYPLYINAENGYTGRIFSYGESERMKLTYENTLSCDVTANIRYNVRNYEGRIVYSADLKPLSLKAGEGGSEEILTGVTDCGTYTLEVLTESETREGEKAIFSRNLKFSIMNTYKEGEERNSLAAICAGLSESFHHGGYAGAEQTLRLPISSVRLGGLEATIVEPSEAVYIDPTVNDRKYFKENGLDVYVIAMRLQSWYNGGRSYNVFPNTELAHNGFAAYAAFLAKQPYIDTIEMFNEWNHSGFSALDQSADGYLEYCKVAYPAIKAAAKEAGKEVTVLAGGSAGFAGNWIKRFIELGGLEYCDGLSYHPYQYKSFDYKAFKEQTEQVTGWMKEYYGSIKPITLTEMGIPEANDEDTTNAGYTHWGKMRALPGMYIMAQYYDVYERIYYFSKHRTGSHWDQREPGFGLYEYAGDINGNAFVAFDAAITFATYMDKLTGAAPGRKVENEDCTKLAYEFTKKDGEKIAALWTSTQHNSLGLNLGTDNIKVYDQFGNLIEVLTSNDGIYNFDLTDEIIYIEGNFTNFEEAESKIRLSSGCISGLMGDSVSFEVVDKENRNFNVELDFDPDVFVFGENVAMKNGKATFRASLMDGVTGRYHIEVKLLDEDGNVMYVARPVVDITTEMIDVKIDTAQVSPVDDRHWVVEATLTNISSTKYLSGELRVSSPTEFSGSTRTFTELVPGETRLIKIKLPSMVIKRPQEMTVDLLLDNGIERSFTAKLDFTSANRVIQKPVIDGKLDFGEWKSTLLSEDRADKYTTLINGTTWGGVENLSVTHKVMWDEDNFYMMAKVRDNIHHTEQADFSTMWKDDSIQFGILANNKETLDSQSLAFTEMCISLNPAGPKVYRHSSASGKATGVVDNCQVAISSRDGYTIYEMVFPWTELLADVHKAKSGDEYAFSFLVNDNDGGGRKGYMFYNGGIGGSKMPTLFGKLRLN